jgi:hypothetical protein
MVFSLPENSVDPSTSSGQALRLHRSHDYAQVLLLDKTANSTKPDHWPAALPRSPTILRLVGLLQVMIRFDVTQGLIGQNSTFVHVTFCTARTNPHSPLWQRGEREARGDFCKALYQCRVV